MMRNTGMGTKNSFCDMIIPEETCTCRYQRRGRRVEGRARRSISTNVIWSR
eukprot:UN13578